MYPVGELRKLVFIGHVAPAQVTQLLMSELDSGPGSCFLKSCALNTMLCILPPGASGKCLDPSFSAPSPSGPLRKGLIANSRLSLALHRKHCFLGLGQHLGGASRDLPGLAVSQVPEPLDLQAACATTACTTALLSRSSGPQVFCTRPSFRKKMQLGLHSWQTSSPFLPWEKNQRAVRGLRVPVRVTVYECARMYVCFELTPSGFTEHCWEGRNLRFSFLPVNLASFFSNNSYVS